MKLTRKWARIAVLALSAMAIAAGARANEHAMELEELLKAFGWDFATAKIRTEKVTDEFYVLFGIGGNIGVSIGEQGVLIVDDQFPQMIPKVRAAIRELGGEGIDFAINTHWHFDHADGNVALGEQGTWLVSQSNSRDMMLNDHVINMVQFKYQQKAYPKQALPVITFDDRMQFHFNDERVELAHFGPAHTTGDAAVIFRGSNVVHLGDVFNRSYPFIDVDNGGDLAGMITFCKAVLKSINKATVVVPGHGEISDYAGLESYVDMLETVHERLVRLVKQGKSLEDVKAAKPTREFDEQYGNPSGLGFIDRAYASVKREVGDGDDNDDDDGDDDEPERGRGLLDLFG